MEAIITSIGSGLVLTMRHDDKRWDYDIMCDLVEQVWETHSLKRLRAFSQGNIVYSSNNYKPGELQINDPRGLINQVNKWKKYRVQVPVYVDPKDRTIEVWSKSDPNTDEGMKEIVEKASLALGNAKPCMAWVTDMEDLDMALGDREIHDRMVMEVQD